MIKKPNVIVILADDLGWGQVSHRGHPHVQTPNIDALTANGLRLDRFYVNGTCGPARAQILTGRAGDRGGVHRSFYRLRFQEKTISQVLKAAGYSTAMFGKWHLNGMLGNPGAPMLLADERHPGNWGFDEWSASTCGIDLNGLMGDHLGNISENPADSSSAIADKTCDFIDRMVQSNNPFFTYVAMSSPHRPFNALPQNKALYEGQGLTVDQENLFGMITELDNAVATIRQKLRDLNIEKDTIVWFLSDNGFNSSVDPDANGGLKGSKGDPYDGGIRVPSSVEWPGRIQAGRSSDQLVYNADIPLTLCKIAGADLDEFIKPSDGIDVSDHLLDNKTIDDRKIPIHRWQQDRRGAGVLVTDRWKIITHNLRGVSDWELYDIQADPAESTDLAPHHRGIVAELAEYYYEWFSSVRKSANGLDYPEKEVINHPIGAMFWTTDPIYASYVDAWSTRPEYAGVYASAAAPFEPGSVWYDIFYDPFHF